MKLLHIWYRSGAGRIKNILCVEQIFQLSVGRIFGSYILPHAVAVQIASSLAQEGVPKLYPVLVGVHVAEIPESGLIQIGKPLILCCIGMPVSHIGAKRIKNNIRGANKTVYFCFPFISVCFEAIPFDSAQIQMSPAVGGQLPAVIL